MPPIDLAARIDAAVIAATGGDAPDNAVAEPAGETAAPEGGAPAAAGGAAEQTPEQVEASRVLAAKRELIEEKLRNQRERRQANGLGKAARETAAKATADQEAAAAERSKWEALRTGTFKDGMAALGRDPRVVFEEMQREAIEASTPEAEMKRMRADFEKQMGEKLAPLQETIDQLLREKRESQAGAYHAQLAGAFRETVQDAKYLELRAEYDDRGLFQYVKHFDKNPDVFVAAAKSYGVRLTDPSQGFTMREILDVLKAAQDQHDQGKQERRSKLLPPASPPAETQSGKPHTVNGTAARSNAGQPIGNDLATERAAPSRKLSRAERIQAEIDRIEKR